MAMTTRAATTHQREAEGDEHDAHDDADRYSGGGAQQAGSTTIVPHS